MGYFDCRRLITLFVFVSLFIPPGIKALSTSGSGTLPSIPNPAFELSQKINRHLFVDSPGRVNVRKNRDNDYQFTVSGKLTLDFPLQLTPAEVSLLKSLRPQPIGVSTSIVVDLSQWPLSNVHYNGSQLALSSQQPEDSALPPQDSALFFSARPGFPAPYLLHITGSVKDIRHLGIDAENLPPTSTGCYLSGIVQTPDDSDTATLVSEVIRGLQQPNCTGQVSSGLLPDGTVPVKEAPKKGGGKGRRPKRDQFKAKEQSSSANDDMPSSDPPLSPPGGSGNGGGRDDRDKDKKDDKPGKDKEDAPEEDEEEDEEQPKSKKKKKKKPAGARAARAGVDMEKIQRYMQRTGAKLTRHGKLDKYSLNDRLRLEAELSKVATVDEWEQIRRLEGFQACERVFNLKPPFHLQVYFGWRRPQEIDDIESGEESGGGGEEGDPDDEGYL